MKCKIQINFRAIKMNLYNTTGNTCTVLGKKHQKQTKKNNKTATTKKNDIQSNLGFAVNSVYQPICIGQSLFIPNPTKNS